MSNIGMNTANTRLQQALSQSTTGLQPAELKMLSTLKGPDRSRMEVQLTLQAQQQAMMEIMGMMSAMGGLGAQAGGGSPNASSFSAISSGATTGKVSTNPAALTDKLFSTGFSDSQQAMLDKMGSGPDRARMEAQLAMQNQQELVAFISNMLKKQNEMAMSVINNIK